MSHSVTKTSVQLSGHYVSAPWRSSGKTLITVALAHAARDRALTVQTYKKGPDYIDPHWLKAASARPCFNLDTFTQSDVEMTESFHSHLNNVELALVEGTMGLHDGLAENGSDSNAAIAKKLDLPVLLIVDCRGMHRTVVALLNGLTAFDPSLDFSGVILNRIKGARHESKIRKAIETYSDLKIFGAVPETPQVHIDEKELGLVPAADFKQIENQLNALSTVINDSCNLDQLFAHNRTIDLPTLEETNKSGSLQNRVNSQSTVNLQSPLKKDNLKNDYVKIGVARDEAFNFYYEDDLRYLESQGAELVEISPIRGSFPENLDGLLIGGGFPERHAEALTANNAFRTALAAKVREGLVVHAECAGLMYLSKSIEVDNVSWPMTDVIDGSITLHARPQGRGYVRLEPTAHFVKMCGLRTASQLAEADQTTSTDDELPTHEFHHSSIRLHSEVTFGFKVLRGHGINGYDDGICVNNVIASYSHFRHTNASPWIDWFLVRVRSNRTNTQKAQTNV